jgi:hypothetical protein
VQTSLTQGTHLLSVGLGSAACWNAGRDDRAETRNRMPEIIGPAQLPVGTARAL